MTNNIFETFGTGATLVFFFIMLLWWIMLFILPFVVYSIRAEAKRHTLLLRGIIDELRASRLPSRPPNH